MKVLLVYPGPRHSTYEVALGYHEALEALGHEVHAYNLHDYVDFYRTALLAWTGKNPDFVPPPDLWAKWSSEPIIIHLVEHAPDVVLIVSGAMVHRHTYELLEKFIGVPKAIILTESPYQDETQALFAAHTDLVFVNDLVSVEPMRALTGKPVVYLPHSYSPARHTPGPALDEYLSEVFFYGANWPERQELFGPLKNLAGFCITGVGCKEAPGDTLNIQDNGELIEWYRSTKIALNQHRVSRDLMGKGGQVDWAWSLGPRAYEIAASGAFQLCDNTRPELHQVFDDSVATYADGADLARKIAHYLAHDDERRDMAAEAHRRVEPCTFERRAADVLLPAIEAL